ncbi:hypothetical protein L1987_86868 [Smallanthus sonchifolius]|uniref:Uncharacterized protein n=1 Tax=Smallanthus sonchifolius TaxID=185202 RepID=A0ACB8Y1R5_9ASTR|nr:hypothetical protein L1987_86868 [Smallanthus sonchifolius]
MVWESPKEAMPWVGLYVGIASLICTLAMAADAIRAIWQWKLWFPNKFFTLNASTITLIAIAMKLPVDLNTDPTTEPYSFGTLLFNMKYYVDHGCNTSDYKWSLGIINIVQPFGIVVVLFENVVQIEEDAKLTDRILRNTLPYITRLLKASEEKEPRNLMLLLEKSTGFNGVVEFENDQVQPLYEEETHNCWSLVLVTLTSIAIALPNIAPRHVKLLLSGMREGLQIVSHIEECLHGDGDTLETRKATKRVWVEVEIYRSWLQIDLQKMARKGKTTNEILRWLGDEAETIVRKSSKKPSIDQSPYKFILASSMYKISQSMLLECDEEQSGSNGEKLFEWLSTIIADILFACFTNLPRVIKFKCHHHAIKKRGHNIRNAAELLGKSKKILKILKSCQLPDMDLDSRAYIDKWRVLPKSQVLNCDQGGASSTRIGRPFIVSIE